MWGESGVVGCDGEEGAGGEATMRAPSAASDNDGRRHSKRRLLSHASSPSTLTLTNDTATTTTTTLTSSSTPARSRNQREEHTPLSLPTSAYPLSLANQR